MLFKDGLNKELSVPFINRHMFYHSGKICNMCHFVVDRCAKKYRNDGRFRTLNSPAGNFTYDVIPICKPIWLVSDTNINFHESHEGWGSMDQLSQSEALRYDRTNIVRIDKLFQERKQFQKLCILIVIVPRQNGNSIIQLKSKRLR